MTTTPELTVTRRSRIGFSWANTPERWTDAFGQSRARIGEPSDEPSVTGYPRGVIAEYQAVAAVNRGNDWRCRWFVRANGQWQAIQLDTTDLWMLLDGVADGITVTPRESP